MLRGPGGFGAAPATKAVWVVVLVFSVVVMVTDSWQLFCFEAGQTDSAWSVLSLEGAMRAVASPWFVRRPVELLTTLVLLYQFRVFERQMGSAKFGVLALSAAVVHALALLGSLAFPLISPRYSYGPFPLVTALAVLYAYDIPARSSFVLFGRLRLTDKALLYTLVAQCVISGWPASALGSLAGLAAGLFFKSRGTGLSERTLPSWLTRCCGAVFLPLLDSSTLRRQAPQEIVEAAGRLAAEHQPAGPTQDEIDQMQASLQGVGSTQDAAQREGTAPPADVPEFSELASVEPDGTAVRVLTGMGFEEVRAREALSRCNNDIQVATSLLLDG